MIPFRPIELEDKETVQRYTLTSKRRNCDLSFSNLYSWRFLYQTEIAEMDGFLLFRFYADNELAYMMPVGEGDVHRIVDVLIEDARSKGVPFRLLGVCSYMRAELEAAFPGVLRLQPIVIILIMYIFVLIWQRFVEKSTSLNGIISIGLKQLILIMNIRS